MVQIIYSGFIYKKKQLFPHVGHFPWLFRTTWGRVVRPLSHRSAGRNSSAIAGGRERARALKQCWRGTLSPLSVTGTGGPGPENHGTSMDTLWWTNKKLWKITILMGKSTISMAIFNCYVSSPEGTYRFLVILKDPIGRKWSGWKQWWDLSWDA